MKKYFLLVFLILNFSAVFAAADSVIVPFARILFHDNIHAEQKKIDKADGKTDGIIKVSNNEAINMAVTDALTRRIKLLEDYVELNLALKTDNEKKRYLNYIKDLLINFRVEWNLEAYNLIKSYMT